MQKVFVESHNIISPLGNTSEENFDHVKNGTSGVQIHRRRDIDDSDFWASIISKVQFAAISSGVKNSGGLTRFETLLIASINGALKVLR